MKIFVLSLISFGLFSCSTTGKVKKEQAQLRLEMAQGMMRGQNYPGALKELLTALDDDPTNPGIHVALGQVYFARERFELSEKHYLKAISLKPDFTEAKNYLARAYIETGRYTKAEELLKQANADLTYENYYLTLANLGILEFKRGNFEKAVTYFKKSLEKDRENCATQVYLGRSFMEMGDFSASISQLEKSMSFCSQADSDEAHYYSAIAYYRNKQLDKAQARFEELISVFPNGANAEKAQKMLDLIKKGST
ncbi:MAG: tetratricopeptide repeat protein [Pseudobdellovibrio sp.]